MLTQTHTRANYASVGVSSLVVTFSALVKLKSSPRQLHHRRRRRRARVVTFSRDFSFNIYFSSHSASCHSSAALSTNIIDCFFPLFFSCRAFYSRPNKIVYNSVAHSRVWATQNEESPNENLHTPEKEEEKENQLDCGWENSVFRFSPPEHS